MALALGACVLTSAPSTVGVVGAGEHRPDPMRLANVLVSYVRYVGKTFWPTHLSPVYLTLIIGPWRLLSRSRAVGVVSAWAVWRASRAPLFHGWFGFWHAGASDWPCAGRTSSHGGSLHVHPSMGLFVALVWARLNSWAISRRVRTLAGFGAARAGSGCGGHGIPTEPVDRG